MSSRWIFVLLAVVCLGFFGFVWALDALDVSPEKEQKVLQLTDE